MRRSAGLAVLLLLVAPLVPASADEAPIRIPDLRVGDAFAVRTVEEVTIPWEGGVVTYRSEAEESYRVELGTLRHAYGDVRPVWWTNRSAAGSDATFRWHMANDLGTGDKLLQPVFVSNSTQTSSLDLGVLEYEARWWQRSDYAVPVARPERVLHDVVADALLAPGVVVERTIDARPRHDHVVEARIEGLAFETLDGARVLRASLVETTHTSRSASVTSSTVWLADGVPMPVRSEVSVGGGELAYSRVREVLSYAAGDAPLPRAAPTPYPAAADPAPETGAYGRDGPAEGSATLVLPLREAVPLARAAIIPTAPDEALAIIDAIATLGVYVPTHEAAGESASWTLSFEAENGDTYGARVTRRLVAGAAPVDVVEVLPGGWPVGAAGFAGASCLTVGGLSQEAERRASDAPVTMIAFEVAPAVGGLACYGYVAQDSATEGLTTVLREDGRVEFLAKYDRASASQYALLGMPLAPPVDVLAV